MPPKAKLELLYTASGTVESNLLVSMLESQGFKVIVIEAGAGAAIVRRLQGSAGTSGDRPGARSGRAGRLPLVDAIRSLG